MRRDEIARRTGNFEDLFAERQVYLRSGLTSRYVVLSRPLQIGVAITIGLLLAWLAYASYSAIANHFQLAGQSRELARLEEANQSLRAAAETAQPAADLGAQAGRVGELTSTLAAAEAARDRARSEARSASAEAERLRRELALAQNRVRELTAANQPAGRAAGADGTGADASPEAGDRLAAAQGQTEELTRALEQARAASEQLTAARAEIAALTEQATTSAAETERVRGDLDAALKDAAAIRQSAQTAEARLTELQAEIERLRAPAPAGQAAQVDAPAADEVARLQTTLANAETRIAELTADLEAAKRAPAAGEPVQGGSLPAELSEGANGQELAEVREQLRTANQRIDELEAAIQASVANLAPLPPPPAPR